ncbi:unnamed protein product [marine sediment metagenome]|uniref:Uncharacterized protein n=1 Tax=marine sediment metagenome TaxID=412755 RepID=X1MLI4_9ZZZZ
MRKICPQCGSEIDEYVYVYRPSRADEIIQEIRDTFPKIQVTLNTIEGNKIEISLGRVLTAGEKKKIDDYFDTKGYIEDEEAEAERIAEE